MTVWVVGNVTEDHTFAVDRLPRAGETRLARSHRTELGGKGLNQALILARADIATRLVAPIGRDAPGRAARAMVAAEIPGATLIETDAPTDRSIITVAEGGENSILSTAAAARSMTPAAAVAALADLSPGDTVLLQGNLTRPTTRSVLELARARRAATVANPSPIEWDWTPLWPLLDLVFVNAPELAHLSGARDTTGGCRALLDLGLRELVVTLGADGALAASREGTVSVSAIAVEPVDTAGAGDTFCGAYLAATLRGRSPEAALGIAASAAALTVGRPGTHGAFPDRTELSACFGDQVASS